MASPSPRFGERGSGWWLATLLLTIALAGCSSWGLREEGLRKHNDLDESAQRARADGDTSESRINYWGLSEKSRQIERDLAQ